MIAFFLVTIFALICGSCAYHYVRGYWLEEGCLEGYKQGILDATPWTCGQAHANPGTTLMCRECGMDRFDDSDVLRNVLGKGTSR